PGKQDAPVAPALRDQRVERVDERAEYLDLVRIDMPAEQAPDVRRVLHLLPRRVAHQLEFEAVVAVRLRAGHRGLLRIAVEVEIRPSASTRSPRRPRKWHSARPVGPRPLTATSESTLVVGALIVFTRICSRGFRTFRNRRRPHRRSSLAPSGRGRLRGSPRRRGSAGRAPRAWSRARMPRAADGRGTRFHGPWTTRGRRHAAPSPRRPTAPSRSRPADRRARRVRTTRYRRWCQTA